MVVRRKKILSRWIDSIGENYFFFKSIFDTIGQTSKILTDELIPLAQSMTSSIDRYYRCWSFD